MVARAAERGTLWIAVAAALAIGGGRFGRRAALRSAVSAGLAAAAAKAVGATPVARSSPASVPTQAVLASAAAVGAAQELPVLAAPLLGLAAAVGYAAVATGGSPASAAAGGAAIGTGAALATRRLWPVAPHDPADARHLMPAADARASEDGQGLVVVLNPTAGSGESVADELRRDLPAAEVVELADGDDLTAVLEDVATRASVLGVAGGDGSVNAAAAVAADRNLPLVVVPAGTLNHFALALGLESVGDAVAAVRAGTALAVDRATIDGHPFVNVASIGSYVDLVDAREKLEDRIGKWPAVMVALFRVLRRSTPVEIDLDGEPRRLWMVFVGNCRYHPAGFAPRWRSRLDDGQLDIRIVDGSRPLSRSRLLMAVVTGRLSRCRAYEQRFAAELHVRSAHGPLRLARDGETFEGSDELTVAKAPTPLVVYAPRS